MIVRTCSGTDYITKVHMANVSAESIIMCTWSHFDK